MSMRDRYRKLPAVLLMVVVGLELFTGCGKSTGEGFAIYVTTLEPAAVLPTTTPPDITGSPFITINDILSYDKNHHELMLTESAFARLTQLEVPVNGLGFAVCVNREVIYSGAFWTPISSVSYDGPVIIVPLNSQSTRKVKIDLGYPSSSFFQGQDPRSDPRILNALAGRVIG